MLNLKKPDMPKGNLYDLALKQPHDPHSQAVLQAVDGTLRKFGTSKDEWNAMGNILIRFGLVVAANGNFPMDETHPGMAYLKRLSAEMFRRLGGPSPFLKIHWEE